MIIVENYRKRPTKEPTRYDCGRVDGRATDGLFRWKVNVFQRDRDKICK